MSDEDGDYIQYPAYSKYFRENTERILGRRLTPHSHRHRHTALLAESGIPLETISRRLGHANSQITKDVYMHVNSKMREKDNSLIKNVKMLDKC
ncbi:MAG: tyrosine-type recombinase/integrase [Bilifractor sp.]|jgi:integrase